VQRFQIEYAGKLADLTRQAKAISAAKKIARQKNFMAQHVNNFKSRNGDDVETLRQIGRRVRKVVKN
jgi:hypothetical protein